MVHYVKACVPTNRLRGLGLWQNIFLAIINVLEFGAVTYICGYNFMCTRHASMLIAGNFPSVSSNHGNKFRYHTDCSPFWVITKIRALLNDTTRILVGCFELQCQNQEHSVGSLCSCWRGSYSELLIIFY